MKKEHLKLDFDWIVHRMIEKWAHRYKKKVRKITPEVAGVLERYTWPGGMRELSEVLEPAVRGNKGLELTLDDLPDYFLENLSRQIYLETEGWTFDRTFVTSIREVEVAA